MVYITTNQHNVLSTLTTITTDQSHGSVSCSKKIWAHNNQVCKFQEEGKFGFIFRKYVAGTETNLLYKLFQGGAPRILKFELNLPRYFQDMHRLNLSSILKDSNKRKQRNDTKSNLGKSCVIKSS